VIASTWPTPIPPRVTSVSRNRSGSLPTGLAHGACGFPARCGR
jgi:hypothetical protein